MSFSSSRFTSVSRVSGFDVNGRARPERTMSKSPIQKEVVSTFPEPPEALSKRPSTQSLVDMLQAGPSRTGSITTDTGLEHFRTAKPDALEDASTAMLQQEAEKAQQEPVGLATDGVNRFKGPLTPLQRTWQWLHASYGEVLREEVIRVMELEAENMVLLKSVAQLPKLRAEVHKLRVKLGMPRKVRS